MDNRIDRLEIFTYKIPLFYPISTSGQPFRSGIIVLLYDRSGHFGIGEVAPLAGLSKETVHDSLKQLIKIKGIIEGKDIKLFDKSIDKLRLFPSVSFGLELAILDLKAKRKGITFWQVIKEGGEIRKKIKINALIGVKDKIEEELIQLIDNGYSSFKIKVRSLKDIEMVKKMRKMGGDRISIRIDANKAFSFKNGIEFGKAVAPFNVDYIEDPLKDPYRLRDFFKQTAIGIGIDEDVNNRDIRYGSHIKAWIIKPGIVGGIKETISLIKEALKNNICPIISNPFYSGIGVSALIQIASVFVAEDIPMGLDPYRWIKEDILEESFIIKDGAFFIEDVIDKAKRINKKILTPVR